MEATPRPWTFDPKSEQIWSPEGLVATVKQRGPLTESDGDFRLLETEANGELIVRAVNSHDRLVEALDDLAALAEHAMNLANRDGGEFNIDAELKAARAALALARGEVE